MNRLIAIVSLIIAASALPVPSRAETRLRLDYVEIEPRLPVTDSDRILVREFFSYQCPHCFAFDPVLRHWVSELPDDVDFERVPISIGYAPWAPIAQAFFALESMGVPEGLHENIFRAIHIGRERLFDKASIARWLGRQGIDTDRFVAAYDSFGVATAVRRAEQQSATHGVFSVPSLAIDGQYLVMIADDGTFEQQLAEVSRLIEEVRLGKSR